jgi:hypothetical protein
MQDDAPWEQLAELAAEDDEGMLPWTRLGLGLRAVYALLVLCSVPRPTAAAAATAVAAAADMSEEPLVAAVELLRTVADRIVLPALARRTTAPSGTRLPSVAVTAALLDAQHRLGDCMRALVDLLGTVRFADRIVLAVVTLGLRAFGTDTASALGAAAAKVLCVVRAHAVRSLHTGPSS